MTNIPDAGLSDPLFGSGGASGVTEPSFLPHSTIYNWSSVHFSKPLLTANDDNEDIIARRKGRERIALDNIVKSITKLHNQVSSWHTKFETRTQAILLEPFSPIVCAADENERIRIWDYKEAKMLNEFDNHDYPKKGVSKLRHLNDLDDGLLLVASCDGNVRIWKDYTLKDNQKLLTAFCAVQIQRPNVGSVNVVVDWQQQSGYLYASGETRSVMIWDLNKEQLVHSIASMPDCSITAMSASEAQAGPVAAGFTDGSIRLFDIRAPKMLNIATQQHNQRVIGIGFQPGPDPVKIVSASQAGDIQFHDVRLQKNAYLTIDAHRGSLTALAFHRNAPIIASGSAKQLIKVFNLNGEQLGSIRYYPTFMVRQIGAVSCLTFHPFQVLIAAGASDARGSSLVMKDLMQDE